MQDGGNDDDAVMIDDGVTLFTSKEQTQPHSAFVTFCRDSYSECQDTYLKYCTYYGWKVHSKSKLAKESNTIIKGPKAFCKKDFRSRRLGRNRIMTCQERAFGWPLNLEIEGRAAQNSSTQSIQIKVCTDLTGKIFSPRSQMRSRLCG